tara:strand:+ start:3827 stop:4246 length:420 start_codon:yes stop_codon:yes gene_type:complete
MMVSAAVLCLALNIYHEARNQPVIGQIAVSEVVLNRVLDEAYPNNICDVVHQAKYEEGSNLPIRNQCQFSWYCDGKSDKPTDIDAYRWAIMLSGRILSGEFAPLTGGSIHYHNTKVAPEWKLRKEKVTQIEDHIFYKRK